MRIALHSLATPHSNLLTSIRIARETEYDAIEINGARLRNYLAQGFTVEGLQPLLKEVSPAGVAGFEVVARQAGANGDNLLGECDEICSLAESINCSMVRLLIGGGDAAAPIVEAGDRGWPDLRKRLATNLRTLTRIGRAHSVRFYLEAPAATLLGPLAKQLELLDETACDDVGLALDFHHLWCGGATPDEIVRLKRKQIFCVDFCDSLDAFGTGGAPRHGGRDVWTGGGRIPLKEWVDAVRATGFNGTWCCELQSPKYQELDPWSTARDLKACLNYMLL